MEPITVVVVFVLGAVALLRKAAPGAPAPPPPPPDPGAPAPPPPRPPKSCEPADTWFRETAASHKVPPEYWNKLTCSEKTQVMALGPFAVNTILLSRGWEAVRDEAEEFADKARDKARKEAASAEKWVKDKLPKVSW